MKLPLYQVDAFGNGPFTGNPAAVCPLDTWLPRETMQAIAAENNLSETAFFVKEGDVYGLRWFTPVAEVDLCGHATLASGHVLFHEIEVMDPVVEFRSKSGPLKVERKGDMLTLDFPAIKGEACENVPGMNDAIGVEPLEMYRSTDYMVVLSSEKEVADLSPDFGKVKDLGLRGLIVTAPGDSVDFVSRFFAPVHGIDEDPVTGSAHCMLAPYWQSKTGKAKLEARQLSSRGGWVSCQVKGERVLLSGKTHLYMRGLIEV
ncbi:MAG: PhzF family phenazine biosynthesis protein [Puniceicoccaceae bacterium]